MPSFVGNPRPRPFAFKADGNVLHAQAFGCWLYVQIGSTGLFFGTHCRRGLRLVWTRRLPSLAFRRFA